MKCSNCNNEVQENQYLINVNGSIICNQCVSKKSTNDIEEMTKPKNEQDVNDVDNIIKNKQSVGIDKRIDIWKEKLIDLSKKNRLLNFKLTKGSTLKIIDEIPPEIFRILYCKTQEMQFLPIKVNSEDTPDEERLSREELNKDIEFKAQEFCTYEQEKLDKKHIDKYLQTNLSEKDLERAVRRISTTAKNTMNDLGYNVLFLTLGSVIWYERGDSDVKFEAPLLLLPIKITRENVSSPFIVEYNDDDVILNPALALKLKKEFQIYLDDIDVSDIQDTDVVKIFECVQKKIEKQKKWKLLNNIYIGLFSFAKFVMYKDIDQNQEKIKASNLIKYICGKGEAQYTNINEVCPVNELDTNVLPQDTYQILDADSSQQQAIAFVKANNNLVIKGPPGTGKSQTIANIIAELLSQGKKVLFVSQKIAALSVVKSRLDSHGLEPYCLELHSDKTNRKQILQNLLDSMTTSSIANHTGSSLEILQKKKIELNEYVKAVSTPIGTLNKKPFEAIGKVCATGFDDFECIFDDFDKWDSATLEYKKSLFTNLKNILSILGNPKLFSWYGAHVQNLDADYRLKLEVKELLRNTTEKLEKLNDDIHQICNITYLKQPSKLDEIDNIIEIAEIISRIPQNTFKKISFADAELSANINKVCECIKQFNIYNNRIKNNYNLGILNEDLDYQITLFEHFNQSFINKLSFNYLKSKKYLAKFFINNYKPATIQILADLKNAKNLKYWLDEINKNNSIAEDIFQEMWSKENTSEEDINLSSESIIKLKKIIEEEDIFVENVLLKYKENGIDYSKLNSLKNAIIELKYDISDSLSKITERINFNWNEVFNCNLNEVLITEISNKFNKMLEDIDNLTIWSQYLTALEDIKQENLETFYNILLDKHIDTNKFDIAFEGQFYRVWLNAFVYQKSNILRNFNSSQHEKIIEQFRKLDEELINSAKLRLTQVLKDNQINGMREFAKEKLELERESKKQRLRKSLRQIILMVPNLLQCIKPCLMMSPLTVAQLLEPDIFKFDYVIFDEASQLTTEDCIGAMFRGKRLIVAGDSNQLPPTSFFKTVTAPSEDEEISENDEEKEDLDSILNECSTSGFPKCMLKWHYRSKDEHLIAFSNKHLYKELYTFPSSVETSDETGIKWHYHENTAKTDANARLEEAQIVAQAVMEHARRFPQYSLGVATFNMKQKDLIEDEIARLRREDRTCEDFFSSNKEEAFFVKNLESIQGDERDVIFISMGYFKNQNNVLPMNFGPINQDGGERRLNVLVTRARYKIELFSAIRYVDFDLDKTKSLGVALLKQYLEYAERGEVALLSNTQTEIDDHFDSPFEEAVCEGLRKAGLSVKTQVGCSGYRIDMAIRNRKNPGEFILGIECDGASYHSSATARDRDRLRQQVLEKLGWKIYRIWSTDWFKNPQKELDKLLKFIEHMEVKKELMQEKEG